LCNTPWNSIFSLLQFCPAIIKPARQKATGKKLVSFFDKNKGDNHKLDQPDKKKSQAKFIPKNAELFQMRALLVSTFTQSCDKGRNGTDCAEEPYQKERRRETGSSIKDNERMIFETRRNQD
jgi:hypothetical protein